MTKLRIRAWDYFAGGSNTVTIKQGQPDTGTVVATQTFSLTGSSPEWNDIVFASPPALTSGTLYSFVFECCSNGMQISRDSTNAYANGQAYHYDPLFGDFQPLLGGNKDYAFETYMSAPGWVDLH